jgi:hypothetical protein
LTGPQASAAIAHYLEKMKFHEIDEFYDMREDLGYIVIPFSVSSVLRIDTLIVIAASAKS